MDLIKSWKLLSTESEKRKGVVSSYWDTIGCCKISVGVEYPSKFEILYFSFDDFYYELPEHNISVDGLVFYSIPSETKGKKVYCLKKNTPKNLDVFDTICRDVVVELKKNNSANGIICVAKLVNRLQIWINFLKTKRQRMLSTREQLGLVGELLVFHSIRARFTDVKEWLNAWRGPEKLPKDIMCNNFEIEVKSIFYDEHQVSISSLRQLEINDELPLFLNVLLMKEGDGGVSLPEVVDRVFAELSDDLEVQTFIGKLGLVKYSHLDKDNYAVKFLLKNDLLFKVKTEFPRITRDDVAIDILDANYTLSLSHLEGYLIEKNTLYKGL